MSRRHFVVRRFSMVIPSIALLLLLSLTFHFKSAVVEAQQTAPLRVACRRGQPPFNDAPFPNSTVCQGLFASIFYRMIELSNISYTMSMISTGSFDPLLIVNSTTNRSSLDMVITYHTITPARVLLYDFSLAMFESADAVALRPKFKKDNRELSSALVRPSVLYVWAIISCLAAGMTLIILLFEWKETDGSFMDQMPAWRRILWAAEMGLESVLTAGTSEDVNSQVVRTFRGFVAVSGVAMLAIFGAVISSQLTAASLQQSFTEVSELGGTKLAISSSTLAPYLNGLGISTVLQNDINEFARDFYSGGQQEFDGFVGSDAIVNYLHNVYGKADEGYTVSAPFYKSGVPDLRAIPISLAVDPTTKRLITSTFSRMRDAGELTAMAASYLAPAEVVATDIPVPPAGQLAITIVVVIVFSFMVLLALAIAIYTRFVKKLPLDAVTWDDESAANDTASNHSATGVRNAGGNNPVPPTEPNAVHSAAQQPAAKEPSGGAFQVEEMDLSTQQLHRQPSGGNHHLDHAHHHGPLTNVMIWKGQRIVLSGAEDAVTSTLEFIAGQLEK